MIKLYNENFMDSIHNYTDATIVTDPPYNINFKYGEYDDNQSKDEYIDMISRFKGLKTCIIHYPEETMKYIVPALGVPDEVNVWCYNSNLPGRQSRLINYYGVVPDYNKVKQPYKNPNDKRIKQRIADGSTGTRSYDWFSDIQLVKNVSKKKYPHPCPVPVKLMERIILLTTNIGDTIIDPFMGSGTTAIACLNTGREFVGFEIDTAYFDVAQERVNDKLMEMVKENEINNRNC